LSILGLKEVKRKVVTEFMSYGVWRFFGKLLKEEEEARICWMGYWPFAVEKRDLDDDWVLYLLPPSPKQFTSNTLELIQK
jgi:hypothetical protein